MSKDSNYFHADEYPTCESPYCRNRLSGEQIANGERCCSEECDVDCDVGSDIVLFDDPFDLDDDEIVDEDDIQSEAP